MGSERLDGPHGLRAQLAKAESDVERFCHGACPIPDKCDPCRGHLNGSACRHARRRAERLRVEIAEEMARLGSTSTS